MAKININSDQWCDMVFEDRNTSFGAYVLRTESSKRHLRALIIASILFIFAITAPILIKEVMKSARKTDTTVRTLDYLDQVKKQAKEEKPIEEMPKEQEQQLIRSTIAFPPPVISEKAPDTIITQESLTKRTEAISTVTVQGNTNSGAVPVTNNIAPTTEAKQEENKIYDVVQVQPNFPGGMNALYEYLSKHINYPPSAREAGIEGRVIIGFVVGKDGRIADVQVLRSLDPACDEEAIKLVKSMPAWTPGKQGDKTVRVRMTLPIVFKLDN